MLAHSRDYLPEALAEAREELERRGFVPGRVDAEVQSILGEIAADEAGKNSEPLGWGLRFVILFLGIILGIPLALYYSIKGGHRRKVKESLLWTIFCFLFWMSLEMLRAVLKDVQHT